MIDFKIGILLLLFLTPLCAYQELIDYTDIYALFQDGLISYSELLVLKEHLDEQEENCELYESYFVDRELCAEFNRIKLDSLKQKGQFGKSHEFSYKQKHLVDENKTTGKVFENKHELNKLRGDFIWEIDSLKLIYRSLEWRTKLNDNNQSLLNLTIGNISKARFFKPLSFVPIKTDSLKKTTEDENLNSLLFNSLDKWNGSFLNYKNDNLNLRLYGFASYLKHSYFSWSEKSYLLGGQFKNFSTEWILSEQLVGIGSSYWSSFALIQLGNRLNHLQYVMDVKNRSYNLDAKFYKKLENFSASFSVNHLSKFYKNPYHHSIYFQKDTMTFNESDYGVITTKGLETMIRTRQRFKYAGYAFSNVMQLVSGLEDMMMWREDMEFSKNFEINTLMDLTVLFKLSNSSMVDKANDFRYTLQLLQCIYSYSYRISIAKREHSYMGDEFYPMEVMVKSNFSEDNTNSFYIKVPRIDFKIDKVRIRFKNKLNLYTKLSLLSGTSFYLTSAFNIEELILDFNLSWQI